MCGSEALCAAQGDVVVQVSLSGLPYSEPVSLQVPLAIDAEKFSTAAMVIEELQPQFEDVCRAQLFPAPASWGPTDCVKEFERQTFSWIRGNCNQNIGYPRQEAHGISASTGGRACNLAIVAAFVRVPGYSRKSRDEYLRNALELLPPLLSDLDKTKSYQACAVLFSDDRDFLDKVGF